MEENKDVGYRQGLIYIIFSFVSWGILPIYWKSFVGVLPYEILAERIVWACITMLLWIVATGKWKSFYQESKGIFADKKQLLLLFAASASVSLNWGIFIAAVNAGMILQSSLGYYINPLVNILFGVYFFKERLTVWTKVAVAFAVIGVLMMIIRVGEVPWVSLSLAITFGIYGLLKKIVKTTVVTGLTLETILVTPLALIYIHYLYTQGVSSWQVADQQVKIIVMLSGAITAVPLLLFSAGARLIPLNVVGFCQYISPTISLFLGIFMYGEVFTLNHFLAFGFIWMGLLIFTLSQTRWFNAVLEKCLLSRSDEAED